MKLHPLSIPYRIVETLFGLLGVLVIGGFLIFTQADGLTALVLIGVLLIAFIIGAIIWQVAYYRRFEYELTDDTFDIASGVISRRRREIPYGRVQNVSINRNVFQRALGLSELRIETAGGDSTEARLRYVGVDTAQSLQDELSRRKRRAEQGDPETVDDIEVEPQPPALLFEITGKELAVLGVASLDSRFLFLVIFGISVFFPEIVNLLDAASAFVVVPIGLLALYVATAAVSAVYSVTNYYGFRLYGASDELRYERGLLQRFSGTIPIEKIQAITVSENVLARQLDYASLLVETAGYSPGETGGSQSAIPIARRERVLDLAQDIEPFESGEFNRPPKRARRRYFFRYIGVLLILLGGAYLIDVLTATDYEWYFVAAAAPAIPIAAHLKWKHRGYRITDDHVIARNGFWNRTTKVVPYHRVQTVFDSQTIFQRRWSLATLTIDTAGSRSLISDESKAVDIDAETARDLRETVLERTFGSIRERQQRRSKHQIRDPVLDAGQPTRLPQTDESPAE